MSAIKQEEIQEVSTHAVDMYIERILEVRKEMVGDNIREFAREKIIETVLEPQIVYNKERDKCPIHIRGEIAIPVRPATENPSKIVVPTTYPRDTYL